MVDLKRKNPSVNEHIEARRLNTFLCAAVGGGIPFRDMVDRLLGNNSSAGPHKNAYISEPHPTRRVSELGLIAARMVWIASAAVTCKKLSPYGARLRLDIQIAGGITTSAQGDDGVSSP